MTNADLPRRQLGDVIDDGRVYTARAAAGGGLAFVLGTAMDADGQIAAEATPAPPYALSEAARARYQSDYAARQAARALESVGSSIQDMVYLEQYVTLKTHADGYFAELLKPARLGGARPVGATAQVAGLAPVGSAVGFSGMAVCPDSYSKSYPGEDPTAPRSGGKFAGLITAGPYAVSTVFPSDRKSGVPMEIRVEDWIWSDSEIRNEAEWTVTALGKKLADVGCDLDDIVHYTLFLTDVGDLYEWDQVWESAISGPAPSRTIVPTKGFALPRREGAYGHSEGSPKMEVQFRVVLPDHRESRTPVSGPGEGSGHQSAATRVGSLLWISSQYADETSRTGDRGEAEDIVAKISTLCDAVGGQAADLLSVKAVVTEPHLAEAVYAALREVTPTGPPVVTVLVTDRGHPHVGSTIAMDAVAVV